MNKHTESDEELGVTLEESNAMVTESMKDTIERLTRELDHALDRRREPQTR